MANLTDNKTAPTRFSRLKAGEFVELTANTGTPDESTRNFAYTDGTNLKFWNGSTIAGITNNAVARTATTDGAGTGTIADGSSYVTVTAGADANAIIVLPTPTPGTILHLYVGATGYELRSSAPATVAINAGTGASAESAVGANVLVRAVCTSATTWVCNTFSTIGTEAALEAAA